MFARGFKLPHWAGFAGILALLLVLAGCVPDPGFRAGMHNRNARTSAVYMTFGLKLNPSFISQLKTPADVSAADLRDFYDDQQFYTTFYRNGNWTRAGELTFQTLKNAESEGLRAEDYLPVGMLRRASLAGSNPQQSDVWLTAGLMAYAEDVRQGRYNPEARNIGPDLLREGIERADFGVFLASLPPQGRSYRGLRDVLGGAVGPVSNARKKQLAVNMERLRWDHEPFGAPRDLRVNIPSQTLEVFKDGLLVRSMSVVVGRSSRKTPVMQDQIVSLKFSPDWTPTRSIVQEDYLNQAQADPAYFDQKGWQVYLDGERTTSASIDWTAVDLDKVTVRQPSGASNALGGVRFSLTNNRAIYLHDTNAHSLFDEPKRLFSSGCVRVEDASWLAHWIMGGQPVAMSMEQVQANMALGTPKTKRLSRALPVSISYLTVWVDGANHLHWEEDVYGHDKRLASKMRFPLSWGT